MPTVRTQVYTVSVFPSPLLLNPLFFKPLMPRLFVQDKTLVVPLAHKHETKSSQARPLRIRFLSF